MKIESLEWKICFYHKFFSMNINLNSHIPHIHPWLILHLFRYFLYFGDLIHWIYEFHARWAAFHSLLFISAWIVLNFIIPEYVNVSYYNLSITWNIQNVFVYLLIKRYKYKLYVNIYLNIFIYAKFLIFIIRNRDLFQYFYYNFENKFLYSFCNLLYIYSWFKM